MISTHTPLAGCDVYSIACWSRRAHFNSHTPRGVRLQARKGRPGIGDFNSHTPRGVRLKQSPLWFTVMINFNSHTPRGVRLYALVFNLPVARFQLTHPSRGATGPSQGLLDPVKISTHTPLAGCDNVFAGSPFSPTPFQLTHPSRGATYLKSDILLSDPISTHTPLAGCDPDR